MEGHSFRLRPVTRQDSAFILELRADEELSRYLHPVSGRLVDQESWYDSYARRIGDWYWIIETIEGAAEGTVGIYNYNNANKSAEWGRWVLRRGSLGAIESAWLIYRAAFEHLGLEEVFCRTLKGNTQVVSFHQRCGLVETQEDSHSVILGDLTMSLTQHTLDRNKWPVVNNNLGSMALSLSQMMRRSRD